MKKWLSLALIFQLLTLNLAFAEPEDDIISSTQNDLVLVGVAGATGAVLGLSTLSFYDEPSTHISNVWTGAAIGVIAGVIWVAYRSATTNQEHLTSEAPSEGFSTGERASWHAQKSQDLTLSSVQFGTQFWQTTF